MNSTLVRFNAKWKRDPKTGCHIWTKGRTEKGYGQFSDHGKHRAHRWIYKRAHKLTDAQMPALLMHTCDNPPCVNERHLMPGTNDENMADRNAKQRCALGMYNGAAHVSDAVVDSIRECGALGGMTQQMIGQKFGVSRAHVSAILRGVYRA